MGLVKSYGGKTLVLGERVYLAETAAVIGDVVLGDDVSIWYNAVVRGDCNFIRIGPRSNIQDNCAIHVLVNTNPTILEEEVTLGHGAIVHGATVRKGALIGISATVMNGADIGESALIGAGALVSPRTRVPPRTLWLGAPARQVRVLSDAEVENLKHFHLNYLGYKEEYFKVDGKWARSAESCERPREPETFFPPRARGLPPPKTSRGGFSGLSGTPRSEHPSSRARSCLPARSGRRPTSSTKRCTRSRTARDAR